ncbi:MAG TPA: MBL fold metallo-hydrolase, partial [Thermomicrobiales bacterium]|nr:MBL fold metallo-hydrolase [Thermomicrobiales bacterium]
LDPKAVRHLLLTHAHADHSGGAAGLRARLDLTVAASNEAATTVRTGDEQRLSLDVARRAGAYPLDYRYDTCPVDVELGDGESYHVGDLVLTALATPGHSGDQLSFVLRQADKVSVFCGDTVFAGGRVLLQDIWDCSVQASCRSVERLAGLGIEGLYPGHLSFSVQRGHRHVDRAMAQVRQLLPPEQLA